MTFKKTSPHPLHARTKNTKNTKKQSELAFRLLCRRHGATCAYTPMMHARLFAEAPSYRAEQFSSTPADRPLMAQFCGNDPATVLAAARILESRGGVDAVDLNLGCPQRIARRGRYGAFLMDEPSLVSAVVATLAAHLSIKVTAKMRIFDDLEQTLAFARMLEASGASLVAVHGRTRDAKDAAATRADWAAIAAVKRALRVPVLANGDVRCLGSAARCLEATGCDGVLSAIPLLEDPALFSEGRGEAGCRVRPVGAAAAAAEEEGVEGAEASAAGDAAAKDDADGEVSRRRAVLFDGSGLLTPAKVEAVAEELLHRIEKSGRGFPVPVVTERAALRAAAAEAAKRAAIEEADREAAALASIGAGFAA